MEEWRDIVGMEGLYQVSNLGRVKSVARYRHPKERIMKQYGCYVRLDTKNGANKLRIDLLVAKAFLPKAKNMEVVVHLDGNESNNDAKNLKWSSITLKEKISELRSAIKKKPENEWFEKDGYIYFKLSNCDKHGICDKDTWQTARKHCWSVTRFNYINSRINNKLVKFHHLVLKPKEGYVIDHINRNPLDNRMCNLRYATQCVNTINQSLSSRNTTGVRGVAKAEKGRYRASITVKHQTIQLGRYETIEEAKRARKEAEEKYFKPIIEKETHI